MRKIYQTTLRKSKLHFYIYELNPNRSLEPKHILYYYRAECLALERRRSRLRQVTKTQDADKKEKMLGNNTIVRRIIHIVV